MDRYYCNIEPTKTIGVFQADFEVGETFEEAAKRESLEETGLSVTGLELFGNIANRRPLRKKGEQGLRTII